MGGFAYRMNTWAGSSLIAMLLMGCSHKDAVDRVVAKESRNEHFGNGMVPVILLPASASPTQIVARALEVRSFAPAAGTNYDIRVVREVLIRGEGYTAVQADTSRGPKVVLLQFHGHGTNDVWWSGVYDAE